MEAEGLDAVCAGLGCVSQDPGVRYIKSDHCLENMKSLQRFLRRDHPTSRPVFKQLGKWNTVGRDLVPIISQYRDDPDLIINAVKVVVFLTMPVDALSENISQQLDYMLDFKASFLHNDAVAVIMTLLEEPLEHLESHTFSEDDWKVVQLVLTLMRNLLDIQDTSVQKVAVAESVRVLSIRDQLLEHLFEENVMDLLLALAHHISGPVGLLRQDSMLFLEIFQHIFWGQSPEKIARANGSNPREKKSKQPAGLLRVMTEEEQEQLKDIRLKDLSRHSRFSGSFVRLAEDGSKKLLKRNPFQSRIETVLRGPRFKHGPVKRIACDRSSSTTSEGKVLELLKTLADQILSGPYNVVMQSVKDDICRERNGIQPADVTLFFDVAKFFTAYQRYKFSTLKVEYRSKDLTNTPESDTTCLFQGQLCGPIASTMDEDMFAMVVSRWHAYAEAAKETNDWISLTVTGTLFKEMVRTLDLVLKEAKDLIETEQQEVRVARILLYKVFYDQTENGTFRFLLHLLKSFDIHKQPRSHLADLIETVHVVLRIIEFLTKADGALRVLKKSRKSNKNKTKAKDMEHVQNQSDCINPDTTSDLNTVNSKANVAAADHSPVDSDANAVAANHAPSNENISGEAVNNESQATAILTESMTAEQLYTVQPIREMDMGVGDKERDITHSVTLLDKHDGDEGGEQDRESEEEAEQEGARRNTEVSLNVQRCAAMFADNTVIRNYCWLLKSFTSNMAATNHYIICMLQRICKDYCLEPMLFQLSLLQIFYEILSNRKASKLEEHQRLFAFLTKLMRNFFKKLKAQPLLFLDVLFWKTRQECHLITTNYKIQTLRKMTGKTGKGTPKSSMADALGNDEAEADSWGSTKDHSEHGLKIDVKSQSTSEKSDRVSKHERRRKGGLFTEEQEAQLKELFEQYKENPKCCHLLAQAIDSEGKITAAHVRRKLKALELSPILQRRRIRKQVECQNDSTDATLLKGMKTKGSKKSNQKHTENLREKVDMDWESSDDETLTQIMKKVCTGMTQHVANNANDCLSNGRKKRGSESNGEHGKEAWIEEDDETIQDLLARRKRARLRGEGGPLASKSVDTGNPDSTRTGGRQQLSCGSADQGDGEGEASDRECGLADEATTIMQVDKSLEDDLDEEEAATARMHVDQSLEDDLEEENSCGATTLSPSLLSSPLSGSSSAVKRRRSLFVVDDDEAEEI